MKSNMGLAGMLIVLAGLGGCASMSSEECMTSDWSAIGFEDGARGYTTDRFGQHRKACAKHGVTPDFTAYRDGREEGLYEYCQPHRGFNVGVSGGGYQGVCRGNNESDFLSAYNAGYRLHTLRSNVDRANSAIYQSEQELARIEETLISNGAAIISSETSNEERVLLLAEMRRLSERTGEVQAEIEQLHETRARDQVELEHYEIVVANMGY